MKAMIFAAGLGSRLKPWTDAHPKALVLVNGKSLLQRNIRYLQNHGIFEVIINVHHFADQIVDAVEKHNGWGSAITISDETDAVLETGGGLQKASWYFEGEADFVVMNVDILTDMDLSAMIRQQRQLHSLATLAVSDRNTSRYFLFDKEAVLSGWRNVINGEEKIVRNADILIQKAFSGIQVINSSLLSLIKEEGKFSMVAVYLDLAKDHIILSYDHTGTHMIDVGKPESILKAEAVFA
ncbi:MAG: sugar phosphate nucleotidyltransferase [Sediminibacterium sp.]|nr:sugar phosphate nucleotidyltransferase [Sediminibacterium sp.]MDP1811138.1 sugar phosphate nucleotidyltransferase [Sediminibacterium sp.]MDP3128638.1 sugar phosphate nucleotidyltransferase [Sediminibacterium sp.]MDP3667731.1 sugar phosphate nucleotidyltransferase [Sediminibacterium sp.]